MRIFRPCETAERRCLGHTAHRNKIKEAAIVKHQVDTLMSMEEVLKLLVCLG
jgi:hypothetical protein